MNKIKVFGHTCYIGETGLANHFRDFFRALSKNCDLKIRNYTIDKNWKGLNDRPHDNENYVNELDKKLINVQSLWDNNKKLNDFLIYQKRPINEIVDVNIVANIVDHHYFYQNYSGLKIAYAPWESNLMPENFFKKINEYDQIWASSNWQKNCMINQGADENKIEVVPVGINSSVFFPEEINFDEFYSDGRFKFLLFGRWSHRKSTLEIIQTFLKTFKEHEAVDLIICVDNSFPDDKYKTTEERLEANGINDKRIKVLHFQSKENYIKFFKKGHVFLSCSRGEGSNLPLIEAMACGTPSIYSNCSGQLEFACGKGHPVRIEKKSECKKENLGLYYEPDWQHLSEIMRDVFLNYKKYKNIAIKESEEIRENFNWDKVAFSSYKKIKKLIENKAQSNDIIKEKSNGFNFLVNFVDGPKVSVEGNSNEECNIKFIDRDSKKIIYESFIKSGMWSSCLFKYYINWSIEIYEKNTLIKKYDLDLKNKKVKILIDSSALGDCIAFISSVEEFRKKHQCDVHCVIFNNQLLEIFKEKYPLVKFYNFNPNDDFYASYRICYPIDKDWSQYIPQNPKTVSLTDIAPLILGLQNKQLKPNLKIYNESDKKYICIGTQSTAQCRYWQNEKWEKIIKYLNDLGYEVWCIDKAKSFGKYPNMNYMPNGCVDKTGLPLNELIKIISGAKFFIGISSGLSWLSWACETPVILISGFSKSFAEFYTPYRVINENVCNGCWNDPKETFDKGNWNWCPRNKNFECSKSISSEMVIEKINTLL